MDHSIFSPKKICIVEDDDSFKEALRLYLNERGYGVATFDSAEDFLRDFERGIECDLIISDIHMSGMSGYDLCREVRKKTLRGRIPFILVTGSDPAYEKEAGLLSGADDFLGKPLAIKDFLAKIRSLLEIRDAEISTLDQMEKLGQLKQFLSPNIAQMVTGSNENPLLKPHRAEVTVFFVDLRRFTTFSEKAEPEEVLQVLGDYYTAVGNAAIKYRGTLGHLAGDGIMIFFNDPEPIESHRETAVQMALEARTELNRQKKIWAERNYGIDFGIGLSEGFATIGRIGFERFSQYSLIGPVVNLASRLCNAADQGRILVSHRFLSRMQTDVFDTQTLGELSLKGIKSPITAYEIMEKRKKSLRKAG